MSDLENRGCLGLTLWLGSSEVFWGRGQDDALAIVDLECKHPTEITANFLFIFSQ